MKRLTRRRSCLGHLSGAPVGKRVQEPYGAPDHVISEFAIHFLRRSSIPPRAGTSIAQHLASDNNAMGSSGGVFLEHLTLVMPPFEALVGIQSSFETAPFQGISVMRNFPKHSFSCSYLYSVLFVSDFHVGSCSPTLLTRSQSLAIICLARPKTSLKHLHSYLPDYQATAITYSHPAGFPSTDSPFSHSPKQAPHPNQRNYVHSPNPVPSPSSPPDSDPRHTVSTA